MRIDDLSDQEKTVMLARLCGWGASTALGGTSYESIFIYTQDNERCVNLYDPANMALAWRVLNHVWSYQHLSDNQIVTWSYVIGYAIDGSTPPADAQRTWLDMILSLAIEAGMVEIDE